MFGHHHLNTSLTQSIGQVLIRNVKVTTTPSAYDFGNSMNITGHLTIAGACTANAFHTSSDASIKTSVETVSTEAAMAMLKNVEARTYRRTDIENQGSRLGFIANDVESNCPEEWGNLVATVNAKDGQILGLDYARFCPILWAICQKQQEQIEQLSARLSALEAPKTKAKTKKATE